MTNPINNHAHNAQTQNTSSEYLAIDFSHRRPSCALKSGSLNFVETIEHFADRAISILEVMQKVHDDHYFVISTVISEIEDIKAVVFAHHEHIKARAEAIKPYLAEHLNTNPQT